MKINTKKQSRNDDIVLSIGMIVKNEEKVLRRCIDSLKPLMDKIKCELIIADTGSTDSTMSIAKEYTDNVFHFEWINDFAAARNSTLEKAKGIWYMLIDADEYLDDDITEMVNFFNLPPLFEKYNTLQIFVRNYSDEEKKEYSDARLPRIYKRYPGIVFEGIIHESIMVTNPMGYFSTILHHTGYVMSSKEKRKEKNERNLTLLRKEYENGNRTHRTLCHLIDACAFEPEETKRYVNEALSLLKKDNLDIYSNILYMQAADCSSYNPELELNICDEYFNVRKDYDKYITTIALHLLRGNALYKLKRYNEAYEEYMAYIDLYYKRLSGELDETDITAHPVIFVTPREFQRILIMVSSRFNNLNDYIKALDIINKISITDVSDDFFDDFIMTISVICNNLSDFSYLIECYSHILNLGEISKIRRFTDLLEKLYFSKISDDKTNFIECLATLDKDNTFINTMKIIRAEDKYDLIENLSNLMKEVNSKSYGYSVVFYLCIKHGIDISDIVEKINVSQFADSLEKIASANIDLAEDVYNYGVPESYTTSIKKFYWITSLYEKASYRSFKLDDSRRYELYSRFVSLLGDYVMNIYNPELLNDEDVQVLPNLHKFGFYMYQAQSALSAGDNIGYIRGMKKALVNCESMKEIVEFMLEQFKKSIK